jgi:hypothetical protein
MPFGRRCTIAFSAIDRRLRGGVVAIASKNDPRGGLLDRTDVVLRELDIHRAQVLLERDSELETIRYP